MRMKHKTMGMLSSLYVVSDCFRSKKKLNPPIEKKSIKIGFWEPVGGVDFLNIRVNF